MKEYSKPRIKFIRILNLYECRIPGLVFHSFNSGMGKTPQEAYINLYNRKIYRQDQSALALQYLGS